MVGYVLARLDIRGTGPILDATMTGGSLYDPHDARSRPARHGPRMQEAAP
jgi:hypothetical protein